MTEIEKFQIENLLKQSFVVGAKSETDMKQVFASFKELFYPDTAPESAILGFDIYKYSQFPSPGQELIPYKLHVLKDEIVKDVIDSERALFLEEPAEVLGQYIDVGDGGFFILENPLQCLALMIKFEAALRQYNGSEKTEALRRILGPLSVRYSITLGPLIRYHSNFYGSALIDNARILSKDRLDRCLIDGAVFRWFQRGIGGIENLLSIDYNDLMEGCGLAGGKARLASKAGGRSSSIFRTNKTKTVMVQKLEEVEAKNRKLEVFSLYLQHEMESGKVTSVGNLNAQGISV